MCIHTPGNPMPARLEWFKEVRACRRREVKEVKECPIDKLFTTPDEFYLLEHAASVTFIRKKIEQKGMLLLDAFRAFDCDRSGGLSVEELYGGLTWLGVELTVIEMKALMAAVDSNADGNVSFAEFTAAFSPPPELLEDAGDDERSSGGALAGSAINEAWEPEGLDYGNFDAGRYIHSAVSIPHLIV
jgi:hypothetical protein